ncbi:unnamed protein product, partial [Coregonus sp. 'balchen']
MSNIQLFKVFLNERLTYAAEEIFGVVEKTIVEYQEEVVRLQRLLDIVLQPEIKLHRAANPDCFAAQSENNESGSGMENGGPAIGFKAVKSKRKNMVKGQSSCITVKGSTSTQLSHLKSPRQSFASPCCCKVCGKFFNYMSTLIRHVKTHTGDKDNQCGVCGEKYGVHR